MPDQTENKGESLSGLVDSLVNRRGARKSPLPGDLSWATMAMTGGLGLFGAMAAMKKQFVWDPWHKVGDIIEYEGPHPLTGDETIKANLQVMQKVAPQLPGWYLVVAVAENSTNRLVATLMYDDAKEREAFMEAYNAWVAENAPSDEAPAEEQDAASETPEGLGGEPRPADGSDVIGSKAELDDIMSASRDDEESDE